MAMRGRKPGHKIHRNVGPRATGDRERLKEPRRRVSVSCPWRRLNVGSESGRTGSSWKLKLLSSQCAGCGAVTRGAPAPQENRERE